MEFFKFASEDVSVGGCELGFAKRLDYPQHVQPPTALFHRQSLDLFAGQMVSLPHLCR
jgi:hypothetical protein